MTITHAKVSAKSDPADTTLVRPSDWNADHVGTIGSIVDIAAGTSSGNASALAAGVALNAAIAAMPAQGGKIRLGRGYVSYNTGSALNLFGLTNIATEGISGLTGGAPGATVIEYLGTGSAPFVNVGDTTGCTFRDMEIRYLSTGYTGDMVTTATSTGQATSLLLDNVLLWGSHSAGQTARLLNTNRSIIGTSNRVFFNGGGIGVYGTRSVVVTGMTAGNPVIVTAPGHGFTNGEKVALGGVITTPPTAISPPNVEPQTVTVIDANTFSMAAYNVTLVTDGTGWATSTGDFANVMSFNDCKFISQVITPVHNPGDAWKFNNTTVQSLASGDVGFMTHDLGNRFRALTIDGGGNYDQSTTNPGSILKLAGSGLEVTGFNASGRSVSEITFLTLDEDACQGIHVAGNNLNAIYRGIDFGTTTAHIRVEFGPNSFDNDRNSYLPVVGTLPPGIAILPGDQPTKPDYFFGSGGNDGGPEPTRLQFDNDALAYFSRSAAGIIATPAEFLPATFGVTSVISPTQLVGNTNNWTPTGLSTCFLIRANVSTNINLTGLAALPGGRIRCLYNATAFTITLTYEDALSTAVNRFLCPGATNFALRQKGSVDLIYSSADSRWLVLGA